MIDLSITLIYVFPLIIVLVVMIKATFTAARFINEKR